MAHRGSIWVLYFRPVALRLDDFCVWTTPQHPYLFYTFVATMYQYELSGQYFDVLGKGAIAVDLIFCVATLHYFLRILIIKYSC